MQQIRLLLAVLLFAGSDAFFLNMFKSKFKPSQQYNYPAQYTPYSAPSYPAPSYPAPSYPAPSYPAPSSYSAYEPHKIPVWKAVPSGYVAQPYSYGQSYSPQTSSYYDSRPLGYSSPDANNYASLSYNSPSGYQPTSNQYDGGNTAVGNSADYTGGSPMISVPVYFPKDASSSAGGNLESVPSTYSNGVSGFYDSSIAGSSSSSVTAVGQAVPVHVPIATS